MPRRVYPCADRPTALLYAGSQRCSCLQALVPPRLPGGQPRASRVALPRHRSSHCGQADGHRCFPVPHQTARSMSQRRVALRIGCELPSGPFASGNITSGEDGGSGCPMVDGFRIAVAARVGERRAPETAQPTDESPLAVRGSPERGGGRSGDMESKSRLFVMRPGRRTSARGRSPGWLAACRRSAVRAGRPGCMPCRVPPKCVAHVAKSLTVV